MKTTLRCLLLLFHSQGGGVFWVKGRLNISGGNFFRNVASDGGVVFASEESSVVISDGNFKQNEALDGGVVFVARGATLLVQGGIFTGNTGENGGGVFGTRKGGYIEVRTLLCSRVRGRRFGGWGSEGYRMFIAPKEMSTFAKYLRWKSLIQLP